MFFFILCKIRQDATLFVPTQDIELGHIHISYIDWKIVEHPKQTEHFLLYAPTKTQIKQDILAD